MWWVYPKCSSITKNCKKLGLGQFFVTVYFLYHYIYIHTHRGNPSEKEREREASRMDSVRVPDDNPVRL